VVTFAKAQVGKPYVYGAAGPGSYDCSGLTMRAYEQVGISLGHYTGEQLQRGRPVGRGELRPGDLVFPSSEHVGIYIGDGMMIHAPKPGDHVKVGSVYAFYTARRLL
jgi:cell wall-associated NlpC family hydrolase